MGRERVYPDFVLFFFVLALVSIGIVMVYSSSAYVAMVSGNGAGSGFYFMEALKRVGLGLLFLVVASVMDYQLWGRLAKPGVLLGLGLLVAVLLFGREVQGSKRWLVSASLQPSELMKIILVFYFAQTIQRKEKAIKDIKKGILPLLVVLGLSCGLVALEPNLGTTAVLAVIGFSLLYLGEAKLSHLLLVGFVALVFFGLASLALPHARYRILSFWTAVDNGGTASVQVKQSLISLGSGGWLGVGLGHSRQKFLFLPTPHTDFIFSILGEELGFLGVLVTLGLFVGFGWRGLRIARYAPDGFGSLVAAGITIGILIHVLLNVGVVSGIFPTTGLPLPFVSFGGSGLLVNLFGVGVLLSISRGANDVQRFAERGLDYARFDRGWGHGGTHLSWAGSGRRNPA